MSSASAVVVWLVGSWEYCELRVEQSWLRLATSPPNAASKSVYLPSIHSVKPLKDEEKTQLVRAMGATSTPSTHFSKAYSLSTSDFEAFSLLLRPEDVSALSPLFRFGTTRKKPLERGFSNIGKVFQGDGARRCRRRASRRRPGTPCRCC